MTNREAVAITGGLSYPSKMPCLGYSIPASKCKVGRKLAKQNGSVCSKCYAKKGNYMYPRPRQAMTKRFNFLGHARWVDAMVFLINSTGNPFFRWHDSGDIQSLFHLCRIVAVACLCPKVKFWLPTREYGMIREYVNTFGAFPKNLVVRLSAYMIDGPPPSGLAEQLGVQTSTVQTFNYNCPASKQGNKCGFCRKCWNKQAVNVAYKKH
jgi:hypothetical protein